MQKLTVGLTYKLWRNWTIRFFSNCIVDQRYLLVTIRYQ